MIEYSDFRTGLSFTYVRRLLKIEADSKYKKGIYMFITRHTVLGRWHEIKQRMYSDYLSENN